MGRREEGEGVRAAMVRLGTGAEVGVGIGTEEERRVMEGTTVTQALTERLTQGTPSREKERKGRGRGLTLQLGRVAGREGAEAEAGTGPLITPPPTMTGTGNTETRTRATQRNIRRVIALSATTTAGERESVVSIN